MPGGPDVAALAGPDQERIQSASGPLFGTSSARQATANRYPSPREL